MTGLAASAPIGYYDPQHWSAHSVDEFTWSDIVNRVYREVVLHPWVNQIPTKGLGRYQPRTQGFNGIRSIRLGAVPVYAGHSRCDASHPVCHLLARAWNACPPSLPQCLMLSGTSAGDIGALTKTFHVCEAAGLGTRMHALTVAVVIRGLGDSCLFRVLVRGLSDALEAL